MQLASKRDHCAPWNESLPDGSKLEYGPSPSTYARQQDDYKLWSYRPGAQPSKLARSRTGEALRAYMRPDGEHLRADVPRRELEVYVLVFEQGHSVRWVARKLELSRSTVKVYVQRLKARAGVSDE